MKNLELLNSYPIVMNIPLSYEGRELPSRLQAKLMLMRVGYDKAVSAFNEKIDEALNGFKPEGFDNLVREIGRMESIEARQKAFEDWNGEGEGPIKPSLDELNEAQKIRSEKMDEYKLKTKDVWEKRCELNNQELDEECNACLRKLTEEEYASIVELVRTDGEFEFRTATRGVSKMPKTLFLSMVASVLVDGM